MADMKPAVDPGPGACLNCPSPENVLSMDRHIAVGFGAAFLTCDGREVFSESYGMNYDDCWTVQQAEDAARKQPDADWQITLHGPLHGETYQRQGPDRWVCIEHNDGFA